MKRAMKLSVDRAKCIGSGQCVQNAPAVFDQDAAEGLAVVLAQTPVGADMEAARRAADLCPARAIRVLDA